MRRRIKGTKRDLALMSRDTREEGLHGISRLCTRARRDIEALEQFVSTATKNNIDSARLKMKRRKRKLTQTQLRVLGLAKAGCPYHLENGERRESRTLTLKSLERRGLLLQGATTDEWDVTEAGKQVPTEEVPAVA